MMPAQGQNKPYNLFVELLLFSLTVQLKKKKKKTVKYAKKLTNTQRNSRNILSKKEKIYQCKSFLLNNSILLLFFQKTQLCKSKNWKKFRHFFLFWPLCKVCSYLVPQPGIESMSPAMKSGVQTTRLPGNSQRVLNDFLTVQF